MRFLADEDLSCSTDHLLRQYNHEAIDSRDGGLRGTKDTRIAQYAQDNHLCLLTGNSDFADIRKYPTEKYAGIIVLPLPGCATSAHIRREGEGTTSSVYCSPSLYLPVPPFSQNGSFGRKARRANGERGIEGRESCENLIARPALTTEGCVVAQIPILESGPYSYMPAEPRGSMVQWNTDFKSRRENPTRVAGDATKCLEQIPSGGSPAIAQPQVLGRRAALPHLSVIRYLFFYLT